MITVDTHVIIWNAVKPKLLSRRAKQAIDNANKSDGIIFCEISLWEIAMLIRKNRLVLDTSYIEFINLLKASNNYHFTGISPQIAELSTNFPSQLNPDPADRIICATCIETNTELVTADNNIQQSSLVRTIW